MELEFCKMSGAGNDFVLLGGGNYTTVRLKRLAARLCDRKEGVGADGLLWVRRTRAGAVGVRYFNSDGSEAFCGNGSRCSAWWAWSSGLMKGKRFTLDTIRGPLEAEVVGREKVRMRMPDVPEVSLRHRGRYPAPAGTVHFLDTGVPHAVVPVKDLDAVDVDGLGRALRFHGAFGPAGANVDFTVLKGGVIRMRTYERGVEAETLACGTGAAASAIAVGMEKGLSCPVLVVARSGENFRVWFTKGPGGSAADVFLEGPAKIVFRGRIKVGDRP